MRNRSFGVVFSAFLVAAAMSLAATGAARAESVMKECGDQWKAAKANNTTNGQTWQEFLKSCRARTAEAPASAPLHPTAAAAPTAERGESVMKQCGDQWRVAKANNTTNGQTWPEFLKSCRARTATGPLRSRACSRRVSRACAAPAPVRRAARPTGAGEFSTEAEAKARCPSDTVVWLNTKSRIYHYAGTRSYGTTKRGAYMCEADANAAGDRASKSKSARPRPQQQ